MAKLEKTLLIENKKEETIGFIKINNRYGIVDILPNVPHIFDKYQGRDYRLCIHDILVEMNPYLGNLSGSVRLKVQDMRFSFAK